MDSFISVPSATASAMASAVPSPAMRSLSGTPAGRSASTEPVDAAVAVPVDVQAQQEGSLDTLKQLDPLAMVLELIEELNSGNISAKDVYNHAGPIRLKLAKAKAALQSLDGLDQSIQQRRSTIWQLRTKISNQTALLRAFQTDIGQDPAEEAMAVDIVKGEPDGGATDAAASTTSTTEVAEESKEAPTEAADVTESTEPAVTEDAATEDADAIKMDLS